MGWKVSDIPNQRGRVAVVTGGNGGLGFETSLRLAAAGAHVVIGARNHEKAEAARRRIEAEATGASVEVQRLDLGSLQSVAAFATTVSTTHPVVDVLFNNAGLMAVPEGVTADGFETQLGTNYLGHFALTMQLLPALMAAPAARVICTTSVARYATGRYDLGNPHLRGCYGPWRAYGISKRACLQFAIELNRRLDGTRVTAYAADPGLSRTELQVTSARSMRSFLHEFWKHTTRLVGQPAAMGALPQLRAGTDPAARPGALYAPRWYSFGAPVERGVSARMRRPEQLTALWELSVRETGCSLPARDAAAAAGVAAG